jgi:hypothetical protein
MLIKLLLGLLIYQLGMSGRQPFRPAKFKGLDLGIATPAQVEKAFGAPLTRVSPGGILWLYYRDLGPVPGQVIFIFDKKKRLEFVEIKPAKPLLESDARRILGGKFTLVRYDVDDCLPDTGGDYPLFESPDGPYAYLVDRENGVALEKDQTRISVINYLAKPVGRSTSLCGPDGIPKAR